MSDVLLKSDSSVDLLETKIVAESAKQANPFVTLLNESLEKDAFYSATESEVEDDDEGTIVGTNTEEAFLAEELSDLRQEMETEDETGNEVVLTEDKMPSLGPKNFLLESWDFFGEKTADARSALKLSRVISVALFLFTFPLQIFLVFTLPWALFYAAVAYTLKFGFVKLHDDVDELLQLRMNSSLDNIVPLYKRFKPNVSRVLSLFADLKPKATAISSNMVESVTEFVRNVPTYHSSFREDPEKISEDLKFIVSKYVGIVIGRGAEVAYFLGDGHREALSKFSFKLAFDEALKYAVFATLIGQSLSITAANFVIKNRGAFIPTFKTVVRESVKFSFSALTTIAYLIKQKYFSGGAPNAEVGESALKI